MTITRVSPEEKQQAKDWVKAQSDEMLDYLDEQKTIWEKSKPRRTLVEDLQDFGVSESDMLEKVKDIDRVLPKLEQELENRVYIRKKMLGRDLKQRGVPQEKWVQSWELLFAVTDVKLKDRIAELQAERERVLSALGVLIRLNDPQKQKDLLDIESARQFPFARVFPGELKQKGNRSWGRCPFHDERTGSFMVDSNNKFHCFSCNKHGDVIDFLMELEKINFAEAVRRLT